MSEMSKRSKITNNHKRVGENPQKYFFYLENCKV